MKHRTIVYLLAGLIATTAAGALQADEKPERAKRQEAREELKSLSPQEREAKFKELQKNRPLAPPNVREELGKVPPGEREARVKELREKRQAGTEQDRQLLRSRIEQRLAELRKKKDDGTITEQEARQLERGEQMIRTFEQRQHPPAERNPAERNPVEKKTR